MVSSLVDEEDRDDLKKTVQKMIEEKTGRASRRMTGRPSERAPHAPAEPAAPLAEAAGSSSTGRGPSQIYIVPNLVEKRMYSI